MFNSETHKGSLVVLTELTDKKGKSVIAAVELDREIAHININKLASTYGKDYDSVIESWFKNKEMPLFVNKEKSLRWFKFRGLLLPKQMNQQGSTYIIENNVRKFKENLEKNKV
ncbi:MAG TPA: hypothetical protein PLP05_10435 [Sedimentisphaerales bacterium]|nr:hypothetical protein [Sedimentisphaerales bacterium]